MSKEGWIYFIACTETERVKIGFTAGDPHKRLKALQTGAPAPLVMMEYRPGTQEEERQLHERFAATRLHGEWFEKSQEIFEYLCFVSYVNAKMVLAGHMELSDETRGGIMIAHEYGVDCEEELNALLELEAAR